MKCNVYYGTGMFAFHIPDGLGYSGSGLVSLDSGSVRFLGNRRLHLFLRALLSAIFLIPMIWLIHDLVYLISALPAWPGWAYLVRLTPAGLLAVVLGLLYLGFNQALLGVLDNSIKYEQIQDFKCRGTSFTLTVSLDGASRKSVFRCGSKLEAKDLENRLVKALSAIS